jgi:replicative DNA helicase
LIFSRLPTTCARVESSILVGGAYYITELTSKVNSAAHIEYHARIIIEKAIKRELIRIASEVHHEAYEDTVDVFKLLDKTEQSLFEVSEINIRKNYADMKSIMHEAIVDLEKKKNQSDGLTGIPTGFTALDRVTSGWQKSDLVIFAARTWHGKNSFCGICHAKRSGGFWQIRSYILIGDV